jgi:hypothetical protein
LPVAGELGLESLCVAVRVCGRARRCGFGRSGEETRDPTMVIPDRPDLLAVGRPALKFANRDLDVDG